MNELLMDLKAHIQRAARFRGSIIIKYHMPLLTAAINKKMEGIVNNASKSQLSQMTGSLTPISSFSRTTLLQPYQS